MFSSVVYTAILATAASAAAFDCTGPYFSFYNRGGKAMSYQRLDPALFPGTESPHLHSFDGGNALTASMGSDTAQSSFCTTARVKPDKSLYWRPTLFWNGNNTGFYRVPDKFLKIYYKFGDYGNIRANVTEFPEGFQMMAGNPFKRSDDGKNPGGVKWVCLGDNYSRIEAAGFPKGFTSCKEGLITEITFPACWNGKDLDPNDPASHMAWPTAGGQGLEACPDGFRVARFPSIFIEFWYDVTAFDGQYSSDKIPWVLSNGDPTGYGFHADFLNGWERGVLARATAETGYCSCGCGCGDEQMKQCFGAENVNNEYDTEFRSCAAQSPEDAEASLHVDKLPGCNPLQYGPSPAKPADCAAGRARRDSLGSKHLSARKDLTSQVDYDHATPTTLETSASPDSDASLGEVFSYKGTETPSSEPPSSNPTGELPTFDFDTTASPPQSSAPSDEGCKAPVSITITNTVTVTVEHHHKRHGVIHHKQ